MTAESQLDAESIAAIERMRRTIRRPEPAQRTVPVAVEPMREPVGIERSLPPEPDFEETFRAHANPATQNGAILAELRRHFGQWLSIAQLEELSGSRRMNSRAADIRKLVDAEGLDVDQQSRPFPETKRLHSYYRLVRKEDSERLKRIDRREATDV
jgi:hypothetical protein